MEALVEMPTNHLEEILYDYITGQAKISGEVILAVCEELSKRESMSADALEIYRSYLYRFLPDDIKKDL